MFTAHPTEAVRRALLKKEREIVTCLIEDIDRSRTPAERRADRERIRLALTTSWQTAEAPPAKPSVADEFEHVGYYLSEVLYRVLPVFYEVFEDALRETYGDAMPALPNVLGFGTLGRRRHGRQPQCRRRHHRRDARRPARAGAGGVPARPRRAGRSR